MIEMNKSSFVKLLIVLLFIFAPFLVSADTNLTGWAWSDTIGWISFSCSNTSSCGAQNYGVIEKTDGTLDGYAWSDNIGWIRFGGLGGFPGNPAVDGTYSQNAKLEASGELRGWIRACAGTQSGPNDCSNMTSRTDGWDGWISLKGNGYGVVKAATGLYQGYGWGDVNVGWVLFDVQNNTGPGGNPCPVGVACGVGGGGKVIDFDVRDGSAAGASLSGNGNVPTGTTPWFVWTIQNAPTVTCDITNPVKPAAAPVFIPLTGLASSGDQSGNALNVTGAYTYRIDCTDGFTESISFTVASVVVPGFSLGGTQTVKIQFTGPGPANSETKQIPINGFGGFTDPVTVSIQSVTGLPAGVTFTYSLNGGAFAANPTATSNYNGAMHPPISFQVRSSARFTKPIPPLPPVTVRLRGTAPGVPDAVVDMIIDPSGSPTYTEF